MPDGILSSTAVRARTTSEAVALASGFEGALVFTDELYSSGVADYIECIRGCPDSERRILLVGHNPTVEELIESLTGEDEQMPTAGLAQISLSIDAWADLGSNGNGVLINLWRPRELSA